MSLVRGTQLITGAAAITRRRVLDTLRGVAESYGFEELVLPSLEFAALYTEKAGPEVLGQMYTFPDRKGRELCLRPEGTATCQWLARTDWRDRHDVKVWYEARCWRYERPQAGRYREFTQFGLEILNPSTTQEYRQHWMLEIAKAMVHSFTKEYVVWPTQRRGLAYYQGDGFEITCPALGAQQQVVGGGTYAEGVGFAVGVDRLCLVAAP